MDKKRKLFVRIMAGILIAAMVIPTGIDILMSIFA